MTTSTESTPALRVVDRYYLLFIFIIALAVRFIHLNSATANPVFDFPLGGQADYLKRAVTIMESGLLGGSRVFFENSPVYAYILAGFFKLFPNDFYTLRFVQIVIGSFNCVMIAWITRHFFDRWPAVISGVMAAFYGPFILYDAEIIVLPWILCFSLAALLIIIRKQTAPSLFFAGLLMGLAIAGRPNLILFPVLLGSYYFLAKHPPISILFRIRSYAVLWLGVFLILTPFAVRNYVVSGEWMLLGPSGGHNFYLGNNPTAKPYFYDPHRYRGGIYDKYKQIAEAETNRRLSPKEMSGFWFKKGVSFLYHHPKEGLILASKKLLFFFNDIEIPVYYNYYFNKRYSPILTYGVLSFGMILPFSMIGFFGTLTHWRKLMPLYAFFSATLATALAIFVIARLRLPAIPVVVVFSAVGVWLIINWCRAKNIKKAVISGIAAMAVCIASYVPLIELSYAECHNKEGIAYWHKGKIENAENSFLKAMALDPANEYPLLNLIKMFESQNDDAKARKYLHRYRQFKAAGATRFDTPKIKELDK